MKLWISTVEAWWAPQNAIFAPQTLILSPIYHLVLFCQQWLADGPLGPPALHMTLGKTADHSAGVYARLISCSGHGIDPRVPARQQSRSDQIRMTWSRILSVQKPSASEIIRMRQRAVWTIGILSRLPILGRNRSSMEQLDMLPVTRMLVCNLKRYMFYLNILTFLLTTESVDQQKV